MATETELKLLATAADMKRLRALPWLRALQVGRARTRVLRSTYFDTPDGRLRAERIGLRLRDDGRRRVQTLKTAGESLGGAMLRGEWECTPQGVGIDAAALAATPLAALFTPETVAALRPLLTTEVGRTELRVMHAGAEMLLAFDTGTIIAGRRRAPLCEIEIELVAGPRRAVFELAGQLAAAAPLALGHAGKLERGLRLLDGSRPLARRWDGSPLRPDMTAAEALQALSRRCVALLGDNAEAVLNGAGAAAVHQARVALRRLRSAITLFKPLLGTAETAAVQAELRWLQQQLGPARDLDVFLAETLAPVAAALLGEPALAALRRLLERRRRAAAEDAAAALRAPRFTTAVLAVGAWTEGGDWLAGDPALLDMPVERMAVQVIAPRERKLRKRVRDLAALSAEERHAARIKVKALRYACEAFLPVLGEKKAGRAAAALASLQGRLGHLNDVAVATALLRQHLPPRAAELQRAAGLVEGWHAGRARGVLREAERAAADWRDLPRLAHED